MRQMLHKLIRLSPLLALGLCALLAGCAPPELPDAWPPALALYPGAILTGASSKPVRGSAQAQAHQLLRIELRTVDAPRDVLQFYDAAAAAAGFAQEARAGNATQDGAVAVAYARAGQRLTLSAWLDQRRTRHSTGNTPPMTKARLELYLPQE